MNLLNCLGVGTVMMNKQTDTGEILVNIGNQFPSQDGEHIAIVDEVKSSHASTTGNTQSSTGLESNGEPASWMKLNSNRITAPDVRVGSKVIVYEWMNSNKKLWTTFGMDNTMRLETIVWAFSASPNIDENTPITPDNFYIITLSTHKKKIELLTGQGNGEAMGFQFTVNLADGWIGEMDSFGGIFQRNAVERSMTYSNDQGTTFSINKKDFSMINKGSSLFKSDESFMVQSKAVAFITETFDIRTNAMTLDTNSAHFTARAGFDFYGDLRLNGEMFGSGNIKTNADVLAGTISLRGHRHPGVETGGGTTAVPI